jgi:O-acetyl-ADP-ribose deacetylase (regulator of RNase III)
MQVTVQGATLELHQGDITLERVDAIVNAANSRLAGGGGVDGAIHRRGGVAIMNDTRTRYPSGCPTGGAVISTAGQLNAKFVIHAVGPVWNGGQRGEAVLLAAAYQRCFDLAIKHDCKSMALPALSTGAYRYPMQEAAEVALSTAIEFLKYHGRPSRVRFVLFDTPAYETFAATLGKMDLGE